MKSEVVAKIEEDIEIIQNEKKGEEEEEEGKSVGFDSNFNSSLAYLCDSSSANDPTSSRSTLVEYDPYLGKIMIHLISYHHF